MEAYSKEELEEARTALFSTLKKCETISPDRLGKSQKTLLERRIKAFRLSLVLIERELSKDQP